MPFKPKANKYDYPENFSTYPKNPNWIVKHQEENMIRIIGQGMFHTLSTMKTNMESNNVLYRELPE